MYTTDCVLHSSCVYGFGCVHYYMCVYDCYMGEYDYYVCIYVDVHDRLRLALVLCYWYGRMHYYIFAYYVCVYANVHD